MGRRALRKPDPALDLSRYLKTVEQLPQPFCAAALFGRVAPLEIEVGSGKGLFLRTAAGQRPEHDFLGSEIAGKYARFAAAKLAQAGLTNALLVHGDAQRLLAEYLPDAAVAAVHVYFPDPWWKKRHHRRRVMNESCVRHIQRVLAPGGELHFWTDVEEYFQFTLELLRDATSLAGPLAIEEQPAEHDLEFRTHFERRMRLHDLPIYRALFRRSD